MFAFLFGQKKEAPPVPSPQSQNDGTKNNVKPFALANQQAKSTSQAQLAEKNPQVVKEVKMIDDKKDPNAESSKCLREDKLDDDKPAKTDVKNNDLGDEKKQTIKNPQSHTSPNPNPPHQDHPQSNGSSPNISNPNNPLPATVLTDPNPKNPMNLSLTNGSNQNTGDQTNPASHRISSGGNQANPVSPRMSISAITPTYNIQDLNYRLKTYKDKLYPRGSKQNTIKKLDSCFEVSSIENYKNNLKTLQKLKKRHDQREIKQKEIEKRKKLMAQKKKEWEKYLKQKKDYDEKIKKINQKKLELKKQQDPNKVQQQQIKPSTIKELITNSDIQVPAQPQKPNGDRPGVCSDCDGEQCCLKCQDFCQACFQTTDVALKLRQSIDNYIDNCGSCQMLSCYKSCVACITCCGAVSGMIILILILVIVFGCPLVLLGCTVYKYCNSKQTNEKLFNTTEQMLDIYLSYQGFTP